MFPGALRLCWPLAFWKTEFCDCDCDRCPVKFSLTRIGVILFLFWPLARCPTLTTGRFVASHRGFGVRAVMVAGPFATDGTAAGEGVAAAVFGGAAQRDHEVEPGASW